MRKRTRERLNAGARAHTTFTCTYRMHMHEHAGSEPPFVLCPEPALEQAGSRSDTVGEAFFTNLPSSHLRMKSSVTASAAEPGQGLGLASSVYDWRSMVVHTHKVCMYTQRKKKQSRPL